MPRVQWPLLHGRPVIEVILTLAQGGQPIARRLLADTGVGKVQSAYELLLDEQDCLLCGGQPVQAVGLSGAYNGIFPVYLVDVRVPLLGFDEPLPVIGVQTLPAGVDGIACFRFLNRFTYGNFANPGQFGLEC